MSEFELQSCDGRQLIQKLTELLLKELVDTRSKVCTEFENILQDFGVTVKAPCNLVDTSLYRALLSQSFEDILPLLLGKLNLPPHIIKLLQNGFDKLSEVEQKDILSYIRNTGAELPPYTDRVLQYEGTLREGYENLTDLEKSNIQQWFRSRSIAFTSNYLVQFAQSYITPKIKCPTAPILEQLIQVVTLLKRIVNKLVETLELLQQITSALSASINALSLILTSLRTAVIANEITLATLAATPTGAAAVFARILQKLDKLGDKIRTDIQGPSRLYGEKGLDGLTCQAAKVVDYVTTQVQVLQLFINLADSFLQSCSISEINTGNLSNINISRSGDRSIQQYRGYTIKVEVDSNSPAIAPLRYAVALDRNGIVVLQGQKSFSSSTQILVEEIQFAIDRLIN